MVEKRNGELSEYECQVGHRFSPQTLSEAQAEALERALWVALRRLNEQRTINEAVIASHPADPQLKKRLQETVATTSEDIATLRNIIEKL